MFLFSLASQWVRGASASFWTRVKILHCSLQGINISLSSPLSSFLPLFFFFREITMSFRESPLLLSRHG